MVLDHSSTRELIVIGNKSDVENQRAVSIEEGQKFARDHNAYFYETNLHDNFNLFTAIQNIYDNINQTQNSENSNKIEKLENSNNIEKFKNSNNIEKLENSNNIEKVKNSNNIEKLENSNEKEKQENPNGKENFLISASGLRNIFFNSQKEIIRSIEISNDKKTELKEDEFCFIIGNYEVITNRFLADFISPRVSHLHHSDITINSICLNDFYSSNEINSNEVFNFELIENFKKITTGCQIEIDFEMSQKLYYLANLLGNEEISNKMKEIFKFDSNIFKIDECLIQLKLRSNLIDQNELTDFVSSKFYSIDKSKLFKLPKSTLYLILSNENLILDSEDSLFDFINELFSSSEKDDACDDSLNEFIFYELVDFSALSDEKIHSFFDSFNPNNITFNLWQKFTKLFDKNSKIQNDDNKHFSKKYYKAKQTSNQNMS